MKSRLRLQKRLNKTFIAALTLMLGAIGVLLWPSGSRAQQEPNRQLVQSGSANANGAKRIALVIGNGAYTKAPPLKNPPNDARDVAATLRTLGFDVTSGINVNQRDMKRLIREFGQKLKAGGSGLFYYAGHGVQSKGRNYLIPVDADIQSEAEVEDSGVDASLVLNFMDDAQNGLNIVILDACRNNPFARSFRSASNGLAQVDAPTGTLIAYATAPGHVASDGTARNGLYTSELLKQMRVPGLSVTDMFMRVRAEVMKQTGHKQVPWEASSLVGSFYFSGPKNDGSASPAANELKVDPAAFELSYWETIKNSTSADDFKSYLEKYPTGQFTALAKNKITNLGTSKPSESPSSGAESSTELAFWDSIKNSTNIDDFNAYLKHYPNGTFAQLANNRINALNTSAAEKEKANSDKRNADEIAARVETFQGTFGAKTFLFNVFANGSLIVTANGISFACDANKSCSLCGDVCKDSGEIACSQFASASIDGSAIRQIQAGRSHAHNVNNYRFNAASPDEAARALAAVRGVCKPKPQIILRPK
jgi:uncharacterized caspase-like protein